MLVDIDETAEAARVGRTLRGKWRLDALIDVGGMAAVYAGTHRNGMRGAVKILHPYRSSDPDVAARFRREGTIANHVAHPNAVRVLDDDVDDDGSVFLVMELLDGQTLMARAQARGGRLPPGEVLQAADAILDVLAAAHDASIVHRDVKPENVFVTTDGRVKLLDFGIARMVEPACEDHGETIAGLPMGSPAFMAPEQARGRWDLVGPWSDLWSVGATMFTLLAGRDVHVEDTIPELLAAIFTKPAPSLAAVVPECDPRIVAVVDRALQRRVADRWHDARTMQAAVRSAMLEPEPRALRAAATRSRTARRAALASSLALATALAIAGVRREAAPPESPAARTARPTVAEGAEGAEGAEETGDAPRAPVALAPLPQRTPSAVAPAANAPRPVPRPIGVPVLRAQRVSIYDRRF